MDLYRFRLIPESPWLTPWQSDTLAGLLCWMCVRTEGDAVLRQQLIEPAMAGRPPFVLSDAFPGDRLPLPAAVRTLEVPAELRKPLKRAQWLLTDAFRQLQAGIVPGTGQMLRDAGIVEYRQLRNTISRSSNTTSNGGGLFSTEESVLKKGIRYLTVYARIRPDFVDVFRQLLLELARWGFGSDRTAGKGQFRLDGDLEAIPQLDEPSDADSCVVLSTFQPATGDPVDGAWTVFTKYGKLGPDFGLENVFKRPLILLRPGACFRSSVPSGWLGRAIPMDELFSREVISHLKSVRANVIHWAFGLCLPLRWPRGNVQYSEQIIEPLATEEQPLLPIEPVSTLTASSSSLPLPETTPPQLPVLAPGQVLVTVLERREISGRVQFFVQEEGKPRGVLMYGVPPPPDKLPQVGDKIAVYRNNQDVRSPQYRWDKPEPPRDQPRGGRRQEGRR